MPERPTESENIWSELLVYLGQGVGSSTPEVPFAVPLETSGEPCGRVAIQAPSSAAFPTSRLEKSDPGLNTKTLKPAFH
jgi:hypothetical protein